MKKSRHLFTDVAVRAVAVAAILAVIPFAPIQAVAAKASAEDRVEARIIELHARIGITPEQEDQWSQVAQVMRENANTLDALIQSRLERAKTMTAVEDMKSYGEVLAAHADGIHKLIPVFEALYNSMSDAQKKEADQTFRHVRRHHHAKNSTR